MIAIRKKLEVIMSVLRTNLPLSGTASEAEPRLGSQTLGDEFPPNGPAAAAFLACGVGSAVLGLAIVLVEASPGHVKSWLNFYDPVGPLSGKTIVAVVAFA